MSFNEIVLIVFGLALFEIISGIDNAVVNADVLATMSPKWRRWFLTYGMIIAVFVIRGMLPLLIVYFSAPGISLGQAFVATFQQGSTAKEIIDRETPSLLAGGGVFLLFVFLHWLFLETKKYVFFLERHIHRHYYFWFYAAVSVILLAVVWLTIQVNARIALGAVIGSTAFFIVNGFKENAAQKEKELLEGPKPESGDMERVLLVASHPVRRTILYFAVGAMSFLFLYSAIHVAAWIASAFAFLLTAVLLARALHVGARPRASSIRGKDMADMSKILYLELIDATFSADGILGAFAFTVSVPLILLGNGIGALVVRYFTVRGAEVVSRYAYLKNGAMYSIGFLGCIMLGESLGGEIPTWVSPVITFLVVGLFLYLSHRELEAQRMRAGRSLE